MFVLEHSIPIVLTISLHIFLLIYLKIIPQKKFYLNIFKTHIFISIFYIFCLFYIKYFLRYNILIFSSTIFFLMFHYSYLHNFIIFLEQSVSLNLLIIVSMRTKTNQLYKIDHLKLESYGNHLINSRIAQLEGMGWAIKDNHGKMAITKWGKFCGIIFLIIRRIWGLNINLEYNKTKIKIK